MINRLEIQSKENNFLCREYLAAQKRKAAIKNNCISPFMAMVSANELFSIIFFTAVLIPEKLKPFNCFKRDEFIKARMVINKRTPAVTHATIFIFFDPDAEKPVVNNVFTPGAASNKMEKRKNKRICEGCRNVSISGRIL